MNQIRVLQGELGQVLLRFRQVFIRVGAYSCAINLLMLMPSVYMLQVYDRVLSSRNGMTLLMLTLVTLVLFALYGVLDWIRARLLMRVGVRLDQLLAERVFGAAMERLLMRKPGGVAQALQDVTALRQFVGGAGVHAFFDLPWAPVYLLVITLLHPWLGVFALCAAACLCFLAWLNEVFSHALLDEANKEGAQANAFAFNNLRGVEALKAMGMLAAMRLRWQGMQARVLALQLAASERAGNIGAVSKALRVVFQSLILGLGAWLAIEDLITPGGMIAASILLGRALAPVDQVIAVWRQWLSARAAHDRLAELLQAHPAQSPALSLPVPRGELLLENASITAPGGESPIVKDLALRIPAGDVVGIVGPSGAGKSSLVRALLGVWPCSSGVIRLDGADVYDWSKDELGAYLGYLPQEMTLFEGSVAENIARYGPLDGERIVEAATLAGCHDMILRLPQGYQSPVGVDGGALSGGQRQRIALARAVYGNPCLVVLDEPNSNLDEAGEQALQEAILRLRQRGATVVVVSHGPRLLSVVDKILALRDGKLLAYGPRDQVMAFLRNGSRALGEGAAVQQVSPQGGVV